ncbi:hypothetical protein ACMA5I_01285 [Paracoccaceae bacterium GXU_MW_L88]
MSARAAAALAWIVSEIEAAGLPYQIVGGLAARAYGATRALHDIDLYVPFEGDRDFIDSIAPSIIWGPETLVEGPWSLTYVKLDHAGQRIEIGSPDRLALRDGRTGAWMPQEIDFASSVRREVLGQTVWVMPRAALIAYKTILHRDVDLDDIAEISRP